MRIFNEIESLSFYYLGIRNWVSSFLIRWFSMANAEATDNGKLVLKSWKYRDCSWLYSANVLKWLFALIPFSMPSFISGILDLIISTDDSLLLISNVWGDPGLLSTPSSPSLDEPLVLKQNYKIMLKYRGFFLKIKWIRMRVFHSI